MQVEEEFAYKISEMHTNDKKMEKAMRLQKHLCRQVDQTNQRNETFLANDERIPSVNEIESVFACGVCDDSMILHTARFLYPEEKTVCPLGKE